MLTQCLEIKARGCCRHVFLVVSSDQHRFAHEITDCFSLSTLVFETNEVFWCRKTIKTTTAYTYFCLMKSVNSRLRTNHRKLSFFKRITSNNGQKIYIYVIYRLGGPYWKNIEGRYFSVRTDLNGK